MFGQGWKTVRPAHTFPHTFMKIKEKTTPIRPEEVVTNHKRNDIMVRVKGGRGRLNEGGHLEATDLVVLLDQKKGW